jgi:GTPase SAR1 family protein
MSIADKLIIEFGGMPEAGKSTMIERLRTWFIDYKGIVPLVLPDQAKSSPVPRIAGAPAFNQVHNTAWAMTNSVNRLIESIYGQSQVIILDRGPIDFYLFTLAIQQRGDFDRAKHSNFPTAMREYLQLFTDLIDCLFLMIISSKESYERETSFIQRLFGSFPQRESKIHLLRELEKVYNQDVHRLLGRNIDSLSNVIIHSGGDIKAPDFGVTSFSEIIQAVEKQIKAKGLQLPKK